jgi:hypothetical protein
MKGERVAHEVYKRAVNGGDGEVRSQNVQQLKECELNRIYLLGMRSLT